MFLIYGYVEVLTCFQDRNVVISLLLYCVVRLILSFQNSVFPYYSHLFKSLKSKMLSLAN